VRDEAFNPARRGSMRRRSRGAYTPALAAMLIFLNRTGFNGLFRVNARGEFNVPHGRYANPQICDEDNLRPGAPRSGPGVAGVCRSTTRSRGRAGRLRLSRPALRAAERTARFTSYTTEGFDAVAQARLQRWSSR
jgi:DNA adenine methylase